MMHGECDLCDRRASLPIGHDQIILVGDRGALPACEFMSVYIDAIS